MVCLSSRRVNSSILEFLRAPGRLQSVVTSQISPHHQSRASTRAAGRVRRNLSIAEALLDAFHQFLIASDEKIPPYARFPTDAQWF
jgi:hypothetical protein